MFPYIHIILPSYGVCAFLGGFLALLLLFFRTTRFSIAFSDFVRLFLLCILGGFLGSKALFVITRLPWLFQNFTVENLLNLIPQSGYVFYGGLLGVLFTIWLFARRGKFYSAEQLFKFAAPAIPLFHCFGRIGCLMAGCCYGVELQNPLIVFGVSVNRFPTQLIEASFEALLFFVIIILERNCKKISLLQVYFAAYAPFRFLVEFFRGDTVRGIWLGLSTSQWISLAIIIGVVVRAFMQRGKITSDSPAPPYDPETPGEGTCVGRSSAPSISLASEERNGVRLSTSDKT